MILQTQRLILREMNEGDFAALAEILGDPETMTAYNGAFSEGEIRAWLNNQLARYRRYGFGLWAVILKETGKMIGQCGLTMQEWNGREVLEVGYLFNRAFWRCGYATEAARACMDYAFNVLCAEEVCSIIRDTNAASQGVARRNGLYPKDRWTKHYRGIDMPHTRFVYDRLKLAAPSPRYAAQVMEYRAEMQEKGDSLDGCAGLEDVVSFEEWAKFDSRLMEKYGSGYVPSTVYLAVRMADERLIGIMDFRRPLTETLARTGGHIGYSVRPSERGRGYAAQMLRLLLPKCRAAGEKRVLLTCDCDNPASRKTILRAGGQYANTIENTERYWIEL